MNNIKDFVKSLVEQVGITDKELREKTIDDLEAVLLDRLIIFLIAGLDENKQTEVINLMNISKREEAVNYLRKNIKNFDKTYENILVEFGNEYLDKMQN